MRKVYLCGASWCRPCQFVRKNVLCQLEEECPGQTEYIDLQKQTEYIDRFKTYRIPMMVFVEDEKTVIRFSGAYPPREQMQEWLKGERNDFDTESCKPC